MSGSFFFNSDFLFIIVIVLMYIFGVSIPKRKREKRLKDGFDKIKSGDKIITSGGIVGSYLQKNGENIIITTGDSKTRIEILKNSVDVIIHHR